MTTTTETKCCSKCQTTKRISEFSRDRSRKDGRFPYCKSCHKDTSRGYKRKPPPEDPVMPEHKACPSCSTTKPASDFPPDRNRKDGLAGRCRDCARAANRAYWLRNRERLNEESKVRKADRRRTHPEEAREADRVWRQKNRKKLAARALERYWDDVDAQRKRSREWFSEHPHRMWAGNYRKRAVTAGNDPVIEDFTKEDVLERYGDECAYCGGEFQELDHFVPVSKGGPHTLDNVRPSCTSCNRKKWDTPGSEWVAEVQA